MARFVGVVPTFSNSCTPSSFLTEWQPPPPQTLLDPFSLPLGERNRELSTLRAPFPGRSNLSFTTLLLLSPPQAMWDPFSLALGEQRELLGPDPFAETRSAAEEAMKQQALAAVKVPHISPRNRLCSQDSGFVFWRPQPPRRRSAESWKHHGRFAAGNGPSVCRRRRGGRAEAGSGRRRGDNDETSQSFGFKNLRFCFSTRNCAAKQPPATKTCPFSSARSVIFCFPPSLPRLRSLQSAFYVISNSSCTGNQQRRLPDRPEITSPLRFFMRANFFALQGAKVVQEQPTESATAALGGCHPHSFLVMPRSVHISSNLSCAPSLGFLGFEM